MGVEEPTIMRVWGLIAASSAFMSIDQSAADEVLVAPSFGGCKGTYRIFPPGISMLLIYLFLGKLEILVPEYGFCTDQRTARTI